MGETESILPEDIAKKAIEQHTLSMQRIYHGVVEDGLSGTYYGHQDAVTFIKQEFFDVPTAIEQDQEEEAA